METMQSANPSQTSGMLAVVGFPSPMTKEELYTRRTRSGLGVNSKPTTSYTISEAELQSETPLQVMPLNLDAPSFSPRNFDSANASMWGILSSLQAAIIRQGEEITTLKGRMHFLEETVQEWKDHAMQARAEVEASKDRVKDLQTQIQQKDNECKRQLTIMQSQIAQQEQALEERKQQAESGIEEMHAQMSDAPSWAAIVNQGGKVNASSSKPMQLNTNDMQSYMQEQQEKIRRANNIVVRGIPEKDDEQMQNLTTTVQSVLTEKYSMQSITLLRAHRVGRKQEGGRPRPIVCTVLEPRIRALILANSSVFLKGSPIYVGEDLTPTQQAERRKRYLERMEKNKQTNSLKDEGSSSPPK